MPKYDMAIIVTIEADNYQDAATDAILVAHYLARDEQEKDIDSYNGVVDTSIPDYETDFEGQRVVYLHPTDQISEYST